MSVGWVNTVYCSWNVEFFLMAALVVYCLLLTENNTMLDYYTMAAAVSIHFPFFFLNESSLEIYMNIYIGFHFILFFLFIVKGRMVASCK